MDPQHNSEAASEPTFRSNQGFNIQVMSQKDGLFFVPASAGQTGATYQVSLGAPLGYAAPVQAPDPIVWPPSGVIFYLDKQ